MCLPCAEVHPIPLPPGVPPASDAWSAGLCSWCGGLYLRGDPVELDAAGAVVHKLCAGKATAG